MQCEGSRLCRKDAAEMVINFDNLSQYRFVCPEHRNEWLYKPHWYRASEEVMQTVLMSRIKDEGGRLRASLTIQTEEDQTDE